jgi:hypothetical protein
LTADNAAKPATADAVNGPRDDRLGGAIEETNSSPFDGPQAKPAGSTDPGFADFEPLENQGFQEPKIDQSGKRREFAFQQINEVTVKITDGAGSNAWTGGRPGASYRTTRAVGWIMGIGHGLWVARYRNRASRPMKLPAAKRYAIEMIRGIRPGKIATDPIGDLNRMQAVLAEFATIMADQDHDDGSDQDGHYCPTYREKS